MMTNIEFDAYLREHKIMPTQQRLRIARVILDEKDKKMSAEEIYRAVNGPWPPVSRATVNNTLRLFVSQGLLQITDENSEETYCNTNSISNSNSKAAEA